MEDFPSKIFPCSLNLLEFDTEGDANGQQKKPFIPCIDQSRGGFCMLVFPETLVVAVVLLLIILPIKKVS